MNTREYITLQVERTRGQLRAAAFIRMGKNSLELRGKTLAGFLKDLKEIGKKPLELIDAGAVDNEATEPLEGDIVSVENAFLDDEGMIWDGTSIRFRTEDGAVVSPDQYEYLKGQPLGPAQIFAESDKAALPVKSVWKSMSRVAREARNDKAKEIFYITFGELIWDMKQGKKEAKKVRSPLFILPIKEENTSSGLFKFKITAPKLKQNSVLRREVMKQTGINAYEGCDEEIPLEEIETVLDAMCRYVREYIGNMEVDPNAFHVCILDSHAEGVCQAVEKNIDAIAASPLTQVFAGEIPFEEIKPKGEESPVAIFPLPTDESQKKVVARVLAGESIYSPAPAGAGKSQTSVNIAANLAIQGKSVCVMSEKLAANEVFLDYAKRIGLDKYCLLVNSNMKTADIVRQIKTIVQINRQYVHTPAAKETVSRYNGAVREYSRLNRELYHTDPALNVSLYELIASAVTAKELSHFNVNRVEKRNYMALRGRLLDLASTCFEVMTDGEFEDFFYRDICADAELRAMLTSALAAVRDLGLDVTETVRNNELKRADAVKCMLANLSRKLALDIIGKNDLCDIGNRKVKAVYRTLVETHLQMQQLYVSYMHQELSARVAGNIDDQFVSTLEKLKVTKVTPQELFVAYGKEILAICPIIITTPTAASNYIYDTGMDDFHTMIIDESSQMQIISLLPYMDRTKQLVVFGDHMQLGITSYFMKADLAVAEDTVKDTAYVDRSVLQAVQGRFPSCALKYHYRSGTEMLIHVSNKTCYDGMLEVVPDIYTKRSALPPYLGLEVIQVNSSPEPARKGGNEAEALEIAVRVDALRSEYPKKSIGIIAFNEKQQEMISDMLEEVLGGYEDSDMLWVRSLENAQGKEADFVFISIGHNRRNQDGTLHKGISEINRVGGENRLNVLFTRARCKNFIVVSFDYKELKKSDNTGIARLYEYIDYAENGNLNEKTASKLTNADHAMVHCISEIVSSVDPTYKATPRIGSDNMAVDIAIKEDGKAEYSLGILMPSFGQTPQETMTKMLVLERAGWRLSPVSPIYFLTNAEAFKGQIARDIREPITFTSGEPVSFDTNREQDTPFTAETFSLVYDGEAAMQIAPITEEDFLAMDFESCYASVISDDLKRKDAKDLNELAKKGNTEANLWLLIRLKDRFIRDGKRRMMLSSVQRLYAMQKERKAAFLFAQMLRIENTGNNVKLIKNLLRESEEIGIGGE